MAIQVCRTGNQGQYEKTFYENSAIYYTRDGFDFDLAQSSKDVVISRLSELMKDAARQTISNTWSQIDIFSHRMNVGDIVIVPKKNSPITAVGIISSQYRYKPDDMFPQKHTRSVDYIAFDINTALFSQDLRYSLRAYRTVFSIRQENKLMDELRRAGVSI